MGIWRYWLTGEHDETDKESLVINLYNRRRKADTSCKNAPRGDRIPRGSLMTLPECVLLEIIEAYTVLMSWRISDEETLARIEAYRAKYYGSGVFRESNDLAGYLGYRLSLEQAEWPRSANLSESLIRHGVERCRRFFEKFPPASNTSFYWNPFEARDIPRASLLTRVDDLESERRAVEAHERQCIDYLEMFYLKGDRNWRFLHNPKLGHWVSQGYALLRGSAIAKAVIITETRYSFRPIEQPPAGADQGASSEV